MRLQPVTESWHPGITLAVAECAAGAAKNPRETHGRRGPLDHRGPLDGCRFSTGSEMPPHASKQTQDWFSSPLGELKLNILKYCLQDFHSQFKPRFSRLRTQLKKPTSGCVVSLSPGSISDFCTIPTSLLFLGLCFLTIHPLHLIHSPVEKYFNIRKHIMRRKRKHTL